MGFSRQKFWRGLPSPSPGDLPDPVIEPGSPALQADSLPFEPPGISVIENRAVLLLMNFTEDELGEKTKREIVPSRQKCK